MFWSVIVWRGQKWGTLPATVEIHGRIEPSRIHIGFAFQAYSLLNALRLHQPPSLGGNGAFGFLILLPVLIFKNGQSSPKPAWAWLNNSRNGIEAGFPTRTRTVMKSPLVLTRWTHTIICSLVAGLGEVVEGAHTGNWQGSWYSATLVLRVKICQDYVGLHMLVIVFSCL